MEHEQQDQTAEQGGAGEMLPVAQEQPKPRKKPARRKDLYTPAEVATELNVTRRTVYTWITDKVVPAHKIGVKLWGVPAHVVEALKAGRDPWRAENGFQGSQVKKSASNASPPARLNVPPKSAKGAWDDKPVPAPKPVAAAPAARPAPTAPSAADRIFGGSGTGRPLSLTAPVAPLAPMKMGTNAQKKAVKRKR